MHHPLLTLHHQPTSVRGSDVTYDAIGETRRAGEYSVSQGQRRMGDLHQLPEGQRSRSYYGDAHLRTEQELVC